MSILAVGKTGNNGVDVQMDRVVRFVNRLHGTSVSSSSGSSTSSSIITPLGGFATRIYNASGGTLPEGYLVVPASSGSDNAVTIANEDDWDILGAVYQSIPPNTIGYIIECGPAMVFFNSLGSTRRGIVQMSRVNSTVNTDHGKAHCALITRPDPIRMYGNVLETRIGEGLALCHLKK